MSHHFTIATIARLVDFAVIVPALVGAATINALPESLYEFVGKMDRLEGHTGYLLCVTGGAVSAALAHHVVTLFYHHDTERARIWDNRVDLALGIGWRV